eukprot:TRINITY_DN10212_c0_g1_i1.p1 TRINITY_DN10212_c0_g1~~TRINITY_DN10212_c0_g1_i1.p1  ORF type:complete len:208 (-),score=26.20 TRINITY_DN10212_c0_g1_i1:57-623(-)
MNINQYKLLLAIAITILLSLTTALNTCEMCNDQGTCLNDHYCACNSGYTGARCTEITTCENWVTPSPLSVSEPPKVLNVKNVEKQLNFDVVLPVVENRGNFEVSLNAATGLCSYPVSRCITKTVDGCLDVFQVRCDWDKVSDCGWSYDDGAFRGRVVVMYQEEFALFEGDDELEVRSQRHVLPISVSV